MKNIQKLFRITFKRIGLWMILLSLFVSLSVGVNVRFSLRNDAGIIRSSVNDMAKDMNMSIDSDKLDKNFIEQADKIANAYQEKYNFKSYQELGQMGIDGEEKFVKDFYKKYKVDYYNMINPLDLYSNIRNRVMGDPLVGYHFPTEGDQYYTTYAQEFIYGIGVPILSIIGLIGMLVTSLEQSLPYYEFTMIYPWKKKDEVWMKAVFVFLFGLLILALNMILGVLFLKSSALGPILNLEGLGSIILKDIILALAVSIISVATGMIAGNFVGHMGLGVVAIGGISLIVAVVRALVEVISSSASNAIGRGFDGFVENLPEFLRPFMTLTNVQSTYPSILGFLLIAIIWAILSYAINDMISAEKAGYMIISRPVEVFTKILGILSLTGLLYAIVISFIYSERYIILNVLVYGLSLLISYKLFDILFKVRLKF